MDTVLIENKTPNYYATPYLYMSLVDEVISEKHMKTNSSNTDCREVFIMRFMQRLKSLKFLVSPCRKHLSKLRAVFHNTTLTVEIMEETMVLLHSIEDQYNIPRTKISKAEMWKYHIPKSKKEAAKKDKIIPFTYLFEADEFWMRSSVLISLYLLIIRFSIANFKLVKKHKLITLATLKQFMGNIKANDYSFKDSSKVKRTIDHWDSVLKNADTLFPPQKNLKSYFVAKNIYTANPKSQNYNWTDMVGCFGIHSLVTEKVNEQYKKFKAYKTYHNEILN